MMKVKIPQIFLLKIAEKHDILIMVISISIGVICPFLAHLLKKYVNLHKSEERSY